MSDNCPSYSSDIQLLYENTYWKQRGVPNDIFRLMIGYLNPNRCIENSCQCYIGPGEELCDKCIDSLFDEYDDLCEQFEKLTKKKLEAERNKIYYSRSPMIGDYSPPYYYKKN